MGLRLWAEEVALLVLGPDDRLGRLGFAFLISGIGPAARVLRHAPIIAARVDGGRPRGERVCFGEAVVARSVLVVFGLEGVRGQLGASLAHALRRVVWGIWRAVSATWP